jgi:hypothetical protein
MTTAPSQSRRFRAWTLVTFGSNARCPAPGRCLDLVEVVFGITGRQAIHGTIHQVRVPTGRR